MSPVNLERNLKYFELNESKKKQRNNLSKLVV